MGCRFGWARCSMPGWNGVLPLDKRGGMARLAVRQTWLSINAPPPEIHIRIELKSQPATGELSLDQS